MDSELNDFAPVDSPRTSTRSGSCFWFITLAAVAWILFCVAAPQFELASRQFIHWAYLAPAFALLISLVAKSDINRASRIYLLFFLIGVASLAAEANGIASTIAGSDQRDALLETLFNRLPTMLAGLLVPLVLGVASYIILADTQSNQNASALNNQSWLENLSNWLSENDAPAFIEAALSDLRNQLRGLQNDYQQLGAQARQTHELMAGLGNACQQATESLQSIQLQVNQSQGQLNSLSGEIQNAVGRMARMDRQVKEMDSVLNQFADVAAHKVMMYPLNNPSVGASRRPSRNGVSANA